MPKRRPPHAAYLAHVVPGLEAVAAHEIATHLSESGPVRALRGFDERTSILSLTHDGPPADLLALRTLEDVFVLAVEVEDVPGSYAGLRVARAAIAESAHLDLAAATALGLRTHRPRKPTFRVIARVAGEHAFRRVDLQQAVERGVLDHFPDWRLVEDDAHVELWVHLVWGLLVTGIRISDSALRQRTYKSASLPASLKPTVAAAMALLSQPKPTDTVLDPMCGSGTILIERAETARYRLLLGGDLNPEAVKAATENVGRRYQPIDVRQWDARALPLADSSVSAVICNLPFGKQIGSPSENRSLYPALVAEWTRVLAPGGRMVLLTSERRLLAQAVTRRPGLRMGGVLPLVVRGLPAAIHLIRRTPFSSRTARASALDATLELG